MKKSFTSSIVVMTALLLSLAFAGVSSAQTQTAPKKVVAKTKVTKAPAAQPATPTYVSMQTVRVKPDMMNEYLAFLKDDAKPLAIKNGVTNRSVWTTVTGGGRMDVVSFQNMTGGLADMDPKTPTTAQKSEQVLGKAGYEAYIAKRNKLSTLFSTSVLQVMPNLSLMPPPSGEPKLVFVSTSHVAPGRTAEYETIIKNDILPIIKKAGAKVWIVTRMAIGGDRDSYTTYLAMDSFADYDKFLAALQREGIDKIGSKVSGIVLRRENHVLRYRADQSIRADAMKASK